MEFTVESTKNGVLLRPATVFLRTEMDEVAGCLESKRRPVKPGKWGGELKKK